MACVGCSRNRTHERFRIRVLGLFEDFVRRGLFHDLACVHDEGVVGSTGNDPKVVGHHHHGHVPLTLFSTQQVEDLVLDGDVQGGGRLVGKEQRRLAGQGAGDGDPLTHAATELVGQPIDSGFSFWNPYLVEEVESGLLCFTAVHVLVLPQVFDDLTSDLDHRVQRGHGVLEDHGDLCSPQASHFPAGQREEVAAIEEGRSAGLDVGTQVEAHDRPGENRLA